MLQILCLRTKIIVSTILHEYNPDQEVAMRVISKSQCELRKKQIKECHQTNCCIQPLYRNSTTLVSQLGCSISVSLIEITYLLYLAY